MNTAVYTDFIDTGGAQGFMSWDKIFAKIVLGLFADTDCLKRLLKPSILIVIIDPVKLPFLLYYVLHINNDYKHTD